MRVLTVGAGVIGTIYGWALAEAGHDVVHLVRPGTAERLADGVVIDVLDKRRGQPRKRVVRYRPALTERPAGRFDLVIVPTKPYQLLDALRQVVPALGPEPTYFLLTQNWQGTAAIDEILPPSRYLFGDAQAGGTWVDGTLVCAIFPRIVMGRVGGGRDAGLDQVAAAFSAAGIKAQVPDDILHTIWIQYAINAGLWAPMVRAGGLRELLANQELGNLSLQAAAECLRVVQARGLDLRHHPEAKLYLWSSSRLGLMIAGAAMRALFRFNKAVARTSAHALADAREIVAAYDEVTGTGRQLGVPMPVMARFDDDMRQFETRRHSTHG